MPVGIIELGTGPDAVIHEDWLHSCFFIAEALVVFRTVQPQQATPIEAIRIYQRGTTIFLTRGIEARDCNAIYPVLSAFQLR